MAKAQVSSIPRWALMGTGAAMALAVCAAAIGGAMSRAAGPGPTVVASRDIRFADLDGGRVGISDAATGATIETVEPGQGNFMRALVRGMARRRVHTVDDADPQLAPFRLTAYEGGRLTIADPETGSTIDLEAFGPTNAQSFADVLALQMPGR